MKSSEYRQLKVKKKPRSKATWVDGHKFHSEGEAGRYLQLKMLEAAGVISRLQPHPKFVFRRNGIRIGSYSADFMYERAERVVVEDYKRGKRSQQYQLRKRLLRAFYGLEIVEV